MKVKDMIEALKALPQEAEVYAWSEESRKWIETRPQLMQDLTMGEMFGHQRDDRTPIGEAVVMSIAYGEEIDPETGDIRE